MKKEKQPLEAESESLHQPLLDGQSASDDDQSKKQKKTSETNKSAELNYFQKILLRKEIQKTFLSNPSIFPKLFHECMLSYKERTGKTLTPEKEMQLFSAILQDFYGEFSQNDEKRFENKYDDARERQKVSAALKFTYAIISSSTFAVLSYLDAKTLYYQVMNTFASFGLNGTINFDYPDQLLVNYRRLLETIKNETPARAWVLRGIGVSSLVMGITNFFVGFGLNAEGISALSGSLLAGGMDFLFFLINSANLLGKGIERVKQEEYFKAAFYMAFGAASFAIPVVATSGWLGGVFSPLFLATMTGLSYFATRTVGSFDQLNDYYGKITYRWDRSGRTGIVYKIMDDLALWDKDIQKIMDHEKPATVLDALDRFYQELNARDRNPDDLSKKQTVENTVNGFLFLLSSVPMYALWDVFKSKSENGIKGFINYFRQLAGDSPLDDLATDNVHLQRFIAFVTGSGATGSSLLYGSGVSQFGKKLFEFNDKLTAKIKKKRPDSKHPELIAWLITMTLVSGPTGYLAYLSGSGMHDTTETSGLSLFGSTTVLAETARYGAAVVNFKSAIAFLSTFFGIDIDKATQKAFQASLTAVQRINRDASRSGELPDLGAIVYPNKNEGNVDNLKQHIKDSYQNDDMGVLKEVFSQAMHQGWAEFRQEVFKPYGVEDESFHKIKEKIVRDFNRAKAMAREGNNEKAISRLQHLGFVDERAAKIVLKDLSHYDDLRMYLEKELAKLVELSDPNFTKKIAIIGQLKKARILAHRQGQEQQAVNCLKELGLDEKIARQEIEKIKVSSDPRAYLNKNLSNLIKLSHDPDFLVKQTIMRAFKEAYDKCKVGNVEAKMSLLELGFDDEFVAQEMSNLKQAASFDNYMEKHLPRLIHAYDEIEFVAEAHVEEASSSSSSPAPTPGPDLARTLSILSPPSVTRISSSSGNNEWKPPSQDDLWQPTAPSGLASAEAASTPEDSDETVIKDILKEMKDDIEQLSEQLKSQKDTLLNPNLTADKIKRELMMFIRTGELSGLSAKYNEFPRATRVQSIQGAASDQDREQAPQQDPLETLDRLRAARAQALTRKSRWCATFSGGNRKAEDSSSDKNAMGAGDAEANSHQNGDQESGRSGLHA